MLPLRAVLLFWSRDEGFERVFLNPTVRGFSACCLGCDGLCGESFFLFPGLLAVESFSDRGWWEHTYTGTLILLALWIWILSLGQRAGCQSRNIYDSLAKLHGLPLL